MKKSVPIKNKYLQERNILKRELAKKDREIAFNALMMDKNRAIIKNVISELEVISDNLKGAHAISISKLAADLKFHNINYIWNEFKENFELVHPLFFVKLNKEFPSLSKAEQKLSSHLKLGLSSKEIAQLSNNTIQSVEVARSRLRKKLNFSKEDNFTSFFSNY